MTRSDALKTSRRRSKPTTTAALHELLRRIEHEYGALPSLNLTAPQAERLWNLDRTTCSFVLMTLIERGILERTAADTYVRAPDGDVARMSGDRPM